MKRFLSIFLALLLPSFAFAELDVHFLDVGHGDCAVIICDGEAMVIDGGDERNSDKLFSFLQGHEISELKFAVATHPEVDHVGGLTSIFYATTVKALYTPVTEYTNDRFEMLMDKAALNAVPVIVPNLGDTFTLGGATLTVLAPVKAYKDTNDMSIVLRLDYGETSFLFTGDAGTAVEKTLLSTGAAIDVDVLKVAHHGGKSASSPEFLAAVSPAYAVISCSARYDNPDPEVLSALSAIKFADILRTDVNGDITAHSDGEHVTFTAETFFVANIKTDVYHRATCSSAQKMKEANKAIFFTTDQADDAGYRPCKNCGP